MRRVVLTSSLSCLVLLISLFAANGPSASAARPTARYIVILQAAKAADPAMAARSDLAEVGGPEAVQVFRHALRGYVADLDESQANALRGRPDVASVERDGIVTLSTTQPGATFGLDRIDQRNRPVSGTYTYNATGAGVTAYIIDTGIRATHQDLAGRVVPGTNTVDGTPSTQDCNGHGTHVSGTVGGTTYGVAKAVSLVAVRVFGCGNSTATSAIIAGVEWATAHHQPGQAAVANMSLGGGASAALDTAVRGLIADGVSVSIAAGNGNLLGFPVDSCSQSPGRVAEGVTVGASDQNDAAASFSNYGTCVDLFAPGVNITSDWGTADDATNTISGTSMATPHVVGVAAQYLQLHPSATPAQVQDAIKALTTKGIVTGTQGGLFRPGTPNNHLLFTDQ